KCLFLFRVFVSSWLLFGRSKLRPYGDMPFVVAQAIAKSYPVGQSSLAVLRDLDLSVETGEMVAIVGASGVGKSTLLHVLGGLDHAERGTVTIGDTVLT